MFSSLPLLLLCRVRFSDQSEKTTDVQMALFIHRARLKHNCIQKRYVQILICREKTNENIVIVFVYSASAPHKARFYSSKAL